ncbi:SAM-dependent methyltransferase [Actinophytocola sp.]|uniref:SAM-dependent methyltransferase n=1 Tax=Actinophytocola sp. TaxID=1872138 RepID=UPI002ED13C10
MGRTLNGIRGTSVAVAALRMLESGRPDRLFEDPYARYFVDSACAPGEWADAADFVELMSEQVAVRTRFLDVAMLGAGCAQVVLLASGMDARPYRLPWPAGTRLYELDFADVLSVKRTALAGSGALPRCVHVEVPVDLRDDWPEALREAGFQPEEPTAWLLEGLLYGLPASAADTVLERLTGLSAPGSALAADHGEDSVALRAARAAISAELVALWQGGPSDPEAWLRAGGWLPEVHDVAEVAARYGRPAPPAFDPARPDAGRGWLITARLAAETP